MVNRGQLFVIKKFKLTIYKILAFLSMFFFYYFSLKAIKLLVLYFHNLVHGNYIFIIKTIMINKLNITMILTRLVFNGSANVIE